MADAPEQQTYMFEIRNAANSVSYIRNIMSRDEITDDMKMRMIVGICNNFVNLCFLWNAVEVGPLRVGSNETCCLGYEDPGCPSAMSLTRPVCSHIGSHIRVF
jgi:hypothetical protein